MEHISSIFRGMKRRIKAHALRLPTQRVRPPNLVVRRVYRQPHMSRHKLNNWAHRLPQIREYVHRMCIRPLPQSIWVDSFAQEVMYENPPQLCLLCGRLGHLKSSCKFTPMVNNSTTVGAKCASPSMGSNVPKIITTLENMESMSRHEGTWKVVHCRQNQQPKKPIGDGITPGKTSPPQESQPQGSILEGNRDSLANAKPSSNCSPSLAMPKAYALGYHWSRLFVDKELSDVESEFEPMENELAMVISSNDCDTSNLSIVPVNKCMELSPSLVSKSIVREILGSRVQAEFQAGFWGVSSTAYEEASSSEMNSNAASPKRSSSPPDESQAVVVTSSAPSMDNSTPRFGPIRHNCNHILQADSFHAFQDNPTRRTRFLRVLCHAASFHPCLLSPLLIQWCGLLRHAYL